MPDPSSSITIAAIVATVMLPGLVIALAVGLRGWLLAAAAPALTFGLVGVAGSVLPVLGLPWGPGTLAGITLGAAAAIAVARTGLARLRPVTRTAAGHAPARWRLVDHLGVAAAVVVSMGVGLLRRRRVLLPQRVPPRRGDAGPRQRDPGGWTRVDFPA